MSSAHTLIDRRTAHRRVRYLGLAVVSYGRARLRLAAAVVAIAGLLVSNAAAGITFSDGTWADSGVACSYYAQGFGYVTVYAGADYASRAGVYGKLRVYYKVNGARYVVQNYPNNWTPLALGLNTGPLTNNWLPSGGTFQFEVMYGKWVTSSRWETRSQLVKVANFRDWNLAGLNFWSLIGMAGSNYDCSTVTPHDITIITPNL